MIAAYAPICSVLKNDLFIEMSKILKTIAIKEAHIIGILKTFLKDLIIPKLPLEYIYVPTV